jgi:hypothetical protein
MTQSYGQTTQPSDDLSTIINDAVLKHQTEILDNDNAESTKWLLDLIDWNGTSKAITKLHLTRMSFLTKILAENPNLPENFRTKVQAMIEQLNLSLQPQNFTTLAWNWVAHMAQIEESILLSQTEGFAKFSILKEKNKRRAEREKIVIFVIAVIFGIMVSAFCIMVSCLMVKFRQLEGKKERFEKKREPEVIEAPKRRTFHLEISNPIYHVKSPEDEGVKASPRASAVEQPQ